MKTTTRLLALLLALCMVFAFAACGKDPSDSRDRFALLKRMA